MFFMRKLLAIFALLIFANPAWGERFIIEDIRVDGIQRISEGNIFSFIPVEVGDELTPGLARSTIRDLYQTGFFSDVELLRDGNTLIIDVKERPAISSISITGNRQIKTDEMLPALAGIGIAEGEIFNQVDLDRVQQELIRQYFGRGYYNVIVDMQVSDLIRNRVALIIRITEGDQARVRHINIVGNESFDEKELREDFETDSKRGWDFWKGRTEYTSEKLSGDLETLRSFYLDRGYIDFAIESTQVSISPDSKDIFVTANIREGEVFTVSDVTITGDLVLPEEVLRQLIVIQPGENFSRKNIEASVENITAVLSNIGYAFANVNPTPRLDRPENEVSLNFFIDPGKRVYVRRIEFKGNDQSKDEVLRREMRQFEGSWFSQALLDRSEVRIGRLGYFDNVNIETEPVDGTDDQIDIIVSVEETPSGNFQIGFGYSQIQGLIASISVEQANFLGSGRQVGFAVSRSSIISQVGLNYTNPYYTDDGVSRGFFLNYTEFDQGEANISSFSTSQAAAGVSFGFPLTEIDFLRLGASAQRVDINLPVAFVPIDPNDPDSAVILATPAERPLGISLDRDKDGLISGSERRVTSYLLDATWARDSRNHFLNPTTGSLNRFTSEIALPGSTREYYKLSYRGRKYWPIGQRMAFSLRADVSFGDSYDNYDKQLALEPVEAERVAGNCQLDEIVTLDNGLPFYEHFFAGGVADLRGFDDNSLGPKDRFCRSVGGDFKVTGGFELAFPIPFVEASGTRLSWFVDVGNVFSNVDTFDVDLLRASTGLSVTWQAPIGPIIINLSQPLKKRDGDRTQALQFSFGQVF